MIDQPQEATSCSFNKIDAIIRELEQYKLSPDSSQLIFQQNSLGNPLYILVAGSGCKAKPFGYPIKVKFGGEDAYVVDVRSVTAISGMQQYRITNVSDFDLLIKLATMTTIWDSVDRRTLSNIAVDLSPIYATWISSTISAAFNLQIDQRTEVAILAAYFYWLQLNVEDNVDKIASRIAIDLKQEFDRVIDVVENAGSIDKLVDFVEALKATSGGIRLKDMDVATLWQVSTGVWSGQLGRTTMEIASEYPPYIVALSSMALVDRSYRRTRFHEYVSLFDRRQEIKQLPESVAHLFKKW